MSVAPVHALVQGVMHGVGRAELLLAGVQSPHTASLSPSTIRLMQDADLVIWVGPALESGLQRAAALVDEDKLLTLSTMRGMNPLAVRNHRHDSSGSGGVGHEDHEAADIRIDPHLWLSSIFSSRIVRNVTERLAEIDPVNENHYRRNAQSLFEQLELWRSETEARLAPVRNIPFMVFHDAFQYFEKEFDLHVVNAVTLNPERASGALRLSRLREQVVQSGVVCLFTEPQFQPDAAGVIVEGTPARIGVLDPVGAGLEPGPMLWFRLMNRLVDDFLTCMDTAV